MTEDTFEAKCMTIDSSGWTSEEVESIKKMLHECSAIVQIPEPILSAPPVHIDREAWEPCDMCHRCGNCTYCMGYECAKDMKMETEKCPKFKPAGNYCWKCGRPLKDYAWDDLEKRLKG